MNRFLSFATQCVHNALICICAFMMASCASTHEPATEKGIYAQYIKVESLPDGGSSIISVSPYDGSSDTLTISQPMTRLILMSSTFVAAVSELEKQDAIVGVSGLNYISNEKVRNGQAFEVGYESSLEFEKILLAKPDAVIAYLTSAAQPSWVTKLKSLGVRVFPLYDFMEEHPLARAQYIEAFGAMLGCFPMATEKFSQICDRYNSLSAMVSDGAPSQILINTPYRDQWFIPGQDSYVATLIHDAGGSILGAGQGAESKVISLEDAFVLSAKADVWLHPGWAADKVQLASMSPMFGDFPVLKKKVYNNTLRANAGGGNDFYESGAVRPDLILEDLIRILRPGILPEGELHYYIELH